MLIIGFSSHALNRARMLMPLSSHHHDDDDEDYDDDHYTYDMESEYGV